MDRADADRCLSMGAYTGFLLLRMFLKTHSDVDLGSVIRAVRQTNSDATNLDFVGASAIHLLVDASIDVQNDQSTLRTVLRQIVKRSQPWWLRFVPYGRAQVKSALNADQLQIMREAGLFDPIPDDDVLAWWDDIAAEVRGSVSSEKMIAAREAERLSLEFERTRLRQLGLGLEPEWVALDDNTLGYDIHSYDLVDGIVESRLIEVKSTTAGSIFVTRNEWDNAASADKNYRFQVWQMRQRIVTEFTVDSIKTNIPVDQGTGRWLSVEIDLKTSLADARVRLKCFD